MSEIPEIVLPAGTRTVAVGDIPRLLASALYPEQSQSPYILKCVTKHFGTNPAQHSPPCGSDELRLVAEIAGPPPLVGQPIAKDELDAYLTRFNTSSQRPEWTIGASVVNETLNADLNRMSAEDDHRVALKKAIRVGSFVPLSHALLPLDASIREALDLGQVFVETFRQYAAQFGILVRIELPIEAPETLTERAESRPARSDNDPVHGVIIQDLADRISQVTADRRPEKWQDATDPDPIRRTIVAAMNLQGWPPDGIPGVLDFICREVESGRVEAFSTFNDLPCTDVSLIRTNPAKWYVTPCAEDYILQAIADAVKRTQDRVRNRSEQYEKQRVEKEAAGRYTLEEAATAISAATGERKEQILAKLKAAAASYELRMYAPGSNQVRRYGMNHASFVREYYEEAYWDDLNAWISANEPRIEFRFRAPLDPPLTAVSNVAGGQSTDANRQWIPVARDEGKKIRAANPKWSKEAIAQRLREVLEAKGVRGRGGRSLSAESIRRHALKGI